VHDGMHAVWSNNNVVRKHGAMRAITIISVVARASLLPTFNGGTHVENPCAS
jgi:hypothetical protein